MILVEKDIGNPIGELFVGYRAIWLHRPRGGYGLVIRVPVWIRSVSSGHIVVEICAKPGKMVRVKREHKAVEYGTLRFQSDLHPMEATFASDGEGK